MPHTPKSSKPRDRHGAAPPHGPTRVGTAPLAPGSSPREDGAGLPLPHERDEAAGRMQIGLALLYSLQEGLALGDALADAGRTDAARARDAAGQAAEAAHPAQQL